MDPFERWDDWEWERAAQEIGREKGYPTKWSMQDTMFKARRKKNKPWGNFSGLQMKTLLAAMLLLTFGISARSTDPASQAIHTFYQGMMTTDYYAAMNSMAKEALGLSINGTASTPVIAKMKGEFLPPVSGAVAAGFGIVSEDTKSTHNGIDVSSALGKPVQAPYQGVVVLVDEDAQLGRIIKLDFGDGWTGVIGNLGDINVVKGQKVKKGDTIGTVGLSAPLKKPWLHFELRYNSQPLNPIPYLASGSKQ